MCLLFEVCVSWFFGFTSGNTFVRRLRFKLGLSLEEFSRRCQIPLETLRSWDRGEAEPDAPTKALLKVTAANPEGAAETLREGELSAVLP